MRGCERKIIMLKGTDSEIFDEAYFLLRRDFKNTEGDEIVREAHRIVESNTIRKRKRIANPKEKIFFAVGAVIGAVLSALLYILI